MRDMTQSTDKAHAEKYRSAAGQGDIAAQLHLANSLLYVPNADDIAEGIALLRTLAKQDNAEGRYAQDLLGSIYCGVPSRYLQSTAPSLKLMPAPDYHEALKWYRRRADAGSAQAMARIGELYARGTPATPQNFGDAYQWYTKAAAGEDGESYAYDVAEMHFHGRGVTQDYAEAARLYRTVRGGGKAMLRLGWLHEHGKGVPQDLAEAHASFNLAREMGYGGEIEAEGNEGFLRVESAMTAEQRAEGWRRYEAVKDELTARARE